MRKRLSTIALIVAGTAGMVGIAYVAPSDMTAPQYVPAEVQQAAEADLAGR